MRWEESVRESPALTRTTALEPCFGTRRTPDRDSNRSTAAFTTADHAADSFTPIAPPTVGIGTDPVATRNADCAVDDMVSAAVGGAAENARAERAGHHVADGSKGEGAGSDLSSRGE